MAATAYVTSRSMAYDHPGYTVHQHLPLGAVTGAGSGAVTNKFVAFTNMQVLSVTAVMSTSGGTSTYTLWNGTATVTAIGAETFSVVRITNTAAVGTAPSLTTATYGPFVLSNYDGTLLNTQTNSTKTGLVNVVQLYGTATNGQAQAGSNAASGGFTVNQGDQLYVVQGTDATIVGNYTLEYTVQPLAPVSY